MINKIFSWICLQLDRIILIFNREKLPNDFKQLFYARESKELLGKGYWNFIMLTVSMFATVLAIGFANGSLKYLAYKMKDPFVRSVTADLHGEENLNEVLAPWMSSSKKIEYNYNVICSFNYVFNYFVHLTKNYSSQFKGRTICSNDPLIETILSLKSNEAIGHSFFDEFDYSVIVTHSMLEDLGYQNDDPPFLFITDKKIPIPIAAKVKRLPGKNNQFLTTHFFHDKIQFNEDECSFCMEGSSNKLFINIPAQNNNQEQVKAAAENYFTRNTTNDWLSGDIAGDSVEITSVRVYDYKSTWKETQIIQIDFSNRIGSDQIAELFSKLKSSEEIKNLLNELNLPEKSFIRFYSPSLRCDGGLTSPERDKISINFVNLENVKDFAEKFYEETGIEVDMARVEAMENYNFVRLLTLIISIVLIIFSVFSINIYISNVLRNHLNKIKMNIGTLKAFGMDIKGIYNVMMFNFILIPLLIGALTAYLFAKAKGVYFILWLVNNKLENQTYFAINNWWTWGILALLLFISYFSSMYIVFNIFSKDPGDLIYAREGKTYLEEKDVNSNK